MLSKKQMAAGLLLGAGAVTLAFGLSSCVSIPKGAKAVQPFDKNKYLGTWYEIARFDFKFERGLERVTATYSLNPDGSIRVDNKGFATAKGIWKESVGKAKFVKGTDEARLKVSFFGPFYAGYNVIAIDLNYQYAMVAGNNLDYLWLLSREKYMPESIQKRFLQQATRLGYDTGKLVWAKP